MTATDVTPRLCPGCQHHPAACACVPKPNEFHQRRAADAIDDTVRKDALVWAYDRVWDRGLSISYEAAQAFQLEYEARLRALALDY